MNTTTMSSPAIEQFAGKGAARAARRRGARMESGQRKPGLRSYLVLVIVLLVSAAPLYYAFLLASSTATSIAQHAIPSLVPEGHLLENIRRVMNSDIGIWQAFRNSLVVAVLTSLSVMFFSTLAGFA
ncbi:MAG TPA: carbohydrate ABC transporter permease, partial [Candidatus Luteococcus avicola]|nr:carbohydrate ABC transporter permease [Candidatus Luteococcus avicola]